MSSSGKARFGGYLRVSTPGQATEGTSLESQREAITTLAGYENIEIVAWYEDAGITGTNTDGRDALQGIFRDIENGTIEGVVSFDLSRFTRDYQDTGRAAIKRITQAGGQFWTVAGGIRNTPGGLNAHDQLNQDIQGAVSSWQIAEIKEKMTRGRKRRVREGGWIGGPPPFGYDVERHGRGKSHNARLVVDDSDAETIRLIARLVVDEGWHFQQVYTHLNGQNTETPSQSSHRKNQRMRSRVRDVWTSQLRGWVEKYAMFWAGHEEHTFLGETIVTTHPAIITDQQAQRLLSAARTQRDVRLPRSEHLLGSRILAPCGGVMHASTSRVGTHTYLCRGERQNTQSGTQFKKFCDCFRIVRPEFEEHVMDRLRTTLTQPDWLHHLAQQHLGESAGTTRDLDTQIFEIEAEIDMNYADIASYITRMRDSGLDDEVVFHTAGNMQESVNRKKKELEKLKRLRTAEAARHATAEHIEAFASDTNAWIRSEDPAEHHRLFELLGIRVIIDDFHICTECEGRKRITTKRADELQLPVDSSYRMTHGSRCPVCAGSGAVPSYHLTGLLPPHAIFGHKTKGHESMPFTIPEAA